MGRFDQIQTTRFQVEVNVPGFDMQKSLASAMRKQEQRKREKQKKQQQQRVPEQTKAPQPDPEPFSLDGESLPSNDAESSPCPPFVINL